MIFYTNNIFAGPLLLMIWAIEFCLMTISIRLIMEYTRMGIRTTFFRSLCQLTNPAFNLSQRSLKRLHLRLPNWIIWAAIYIVALFLKSFLIFLMKL